MEKVAGKYTNLAGFLNELAKKYPDKVAIETKRGFRLETFSYKQLHELSVLTAAYLQSIGVKKGDRVVLWAPNMPEWVTLFFGTLKLGAIVVPIDARISSEVGKSFIRITNPKVVFQSRFSRKVHSSPKLRTIDMETIWRTLTDERPKTTADKITWNEIAEIVFTSGTTGKPKGVVLTHGNLLSDLKMFTDVFPASDKYQFLSILPLSHMYEQTMGLLCPMYYGARITYLPNINSLMIGKTLKERGIVGMILVPEILSLLLGAVKQGAAQKGKTKTLEHLFAVAKLMPSMSLRKFIFRRVHKNFGGKLEFIACGGAPLDLRLARAWELMGVRILQGYGATETSPLITANTMRHHRLASIGRVLPGISLKITDGGEILVKGPNVSNGYYKAPHLTRAAFENGWYRTGDIGYMGRGGYLYLRGRNKNMIVLADGSNVYPEDVEKVLNENSGIITSCVVELEKDNKTLIHAVVLPQNARTFNLEQAIAKANEKLESHQVIGSASVWTDKDFPRTHTLKVDRVAIKKSVAGQGIKPTLKVPAPPAVNSDRLVSIVAGITNKHSSTIDNDKLLVRDLGFDSLMRLELIAYIEEEFGVSVDEKEISPKTRIRDLRRLIGRPTNTQKKVVFRKWQVNPVTRTIGALIRGIFLYPLLQLVSPGEVENRNNFDKVRGPALFIFNHTSHLDIPLIFRSLPRKLRSRLAVAAAQDYFFKRKSLNVFLTILLNIFPFPRTGSIRPGLEQVGEFLDLGWSVAISPEGTRSPNGKLQPFKSGVGFMAIAMGVPVIPIKIEGAYNVLSKGVSFPKPGHVSLRVGSPIIFDRTTTYAQATRAMYKALGSL